jgi:mercuric ion transport protein
MDRNSKLMTTGIVAALLALLCCATPALVIALAAMGLAAYAGKADYVAIALFVASMALIGFAIARRRRQP